MAVVVQKEALGGGGAIGGWRVGREKARVFEQSELGHRKFGKISLTARGGGQAADTEDAEEYGGDF